MAYQLAKEGFNIIIMSRTQDKMENVARNIEQRYGVQTKIVKFDFNELINTKNIERMYEILDSITEDVSILVNNVGKANVNLLHIQEISMILQQMRVNMFSQVFMSKYFIPKFLSRYSPT